MPCTAMHLESGPEASYRSGVTLTLALVTVVFFIVAPDRPLSHAVALLLMGALETRRLAGAGAGTAG
jgi:phage terminase large subunit-like protein